MIVIAVLLNSFIMPEVRKLGAFDMGVHLFPCPKDIRKKLMWLG